MFASYVLLLFSCLFLMQSTVSFAMLTRRTFWCLVVLDSFVWTDSLRLAPCWAGPCPCFPAFAVLAVDLVAPFWILVLLGFMLVTCPVLLAR